MKNFTEQLSDMVLAAHASAVGDLSQLSGLTHTSASVSFRWTEMYPIHIELRINPDNSFDEYVDGERSSAATFKTLAQYKAYIEELFS